MLAHRTQSSIHTHQLIAFIFGGRQGQQKLVLNVLSKVLQGEINKNDSKTSQKAMHHSVFSSIQL